MICWNKEVETRAEKEKANLQLTGIKRNIARAYEKNYFYQKKMDKYSLIPENMISLIDLNKFPFTTKKDLIENYPYGLLPMPISGVMDLLPFECLNGKCATLALTKHDREMLQERIARILVSCDITICSIIMIALDYNNVAARNIYIGAEKIGAAVISAGSLTVKERIQRIQEFGITTLVTSMGELLNMLEYCQNHAIEKLSITAVFLEDRECTYEERKKLESLLNAKVYFIYGEMALGGVGIAGECMMQNGMHLQEDDFYAEIIDPKTGQLLSNGQFGELVLTTITAEGMPLIRYRTGEIRCLNRNCCSCGRSTLRISKAI